MKNVVLLLLTLLLVAYMVLVALKLPAVDSNRICTGVEMEIADSTIHFIDKREVRRELAEKGFEFEGVPVDLINTDKIERELMKNEVLKSAECYITLSGKLHIDLEQRVPIMRVAGAYGSFYLDREGAVMPTCRRFTAYLPLVTGYVDKPFARNVLYPLALYLQENPFWQDQIEQIHITELHEIEIIPRVGKHLVYLGNIDNFEQKLDNLMLFYQKVIPHAGWNRYESVNLKYNQQIICTLISKK